MRIPTAASATAGLLMAALPLIVMTGAVFGF